MDFFKDILENDDLDELNALKVWFFKENIRLQTFENELKEKEDELKEEEDKLSKKQEQFRREAAETKRRLTKEQKRLKKDEDFFEQKLDILKYGFAQLDIERMKVRKERIQLEADRNAQMNYSRQERSADIAELLFQGVNSPIALKKRYRDLLKMFHPDNMGGDHNMVLTINKIYEELKHDYEIGKRA